MSFIMRKQEIKSAIIQIRDIRVIAQIIFDEYARESPGSASFGLTLTAKNGERIFSNDLTPIENGQLEQHEFRAVTIEFSSLDESKSISLTIIEPDPMIYDLDPSRRLHSLERSEIMVRGLDQNWEISMLRRLTACFDGVPSPIIPGHGLAEIAGYALWFLYPPAAIRLFSQLSFNTASPDELKFIVIGSLIGAFALAFLHHYLVTLRLARMRKVVLLATGRNHANLVEDRERQVKFGMIINFLVSALLILIIVI